MEKHVNVINGRIIGICYLPEIVSNDMTLPLSKDVPAEVGIGWRYINGEFLPPPEPTEAKTLAKELKSVTRELKQIYKKETAEAGFAAFLGEVQVKPLTMSISAAPSRKDELISRRNTIKQRLDELAEKVNT